MLFLAGNSLANDASTEVLIKFFSALQNADSKTAIQLSMKFPEFPAGYLESKIERLAEATASKGEVPKIIKSKEMTEVAVVIIDEKPSNNAPDIDPVYLIKDGVTWKVTINMKFDAFSPVKVSNKIVEEFALLKAWYESEEAVLKKPAK